MGRQPTPAEARAMLERLRQLDPLTHYTLKPNPSYVDPKTKQQYRLGPGPTQLECWRSLAPYRLLEAGNQLGKTTHCLVECAAFARGQHPVRKWYGPVEILVVVPSRSQAVSIWHRRLCERSKIKGPAYSQPLIPKHEIKKIHYAYSGSGKVPGRIELHNGSNIWFAWAGDQSQWERIQGNEYDAIFRDEASGNQRLGTELMMRLTTIQSDPGKPGGGFILWSATPTLINREFQEYKERCLKREGGHEHFLIQPDENPAQAKEVREALRQVFNEHEQAVRLDGSRSEHERYLIYADFFDVKRHVAAEDYLPGIDDTLYIAFDPAFGRTASDVGILCAAINKANPYQIRVVKFYHYKGGTLVDHVERMRDWLLGRAVEAIVCDPAILKTESTGRSVYTQLVDLINTKDHHIKTHRGVILGRNRLDDGIPLVRSYLDQDLIRVNPHSAGCGMVVYGFNDYATREESRYSGPRGVVRKNTEAMDCIRYLVTIEPHWVNRGLNHATEDPRHVLQRLDPNQAPVVSDITKLSPDERLHLQRLQQSAQLVTRYGPRGDAGGWPSRRIC